MDLDAEQPVTCVCLDLIKERAPKEPKWTHPFATSAVLDLLNVAYKADKAQGSYWEMSQAFMLERTFLKSTPFSSVGKNKRQRTEERSPVMGSIFQDQRTFQFLAAKSNYIANKLADALADWSDDELQEEYPVYLDGGRRWAWRKSKETRRVVAPPWLIKKVDAVSAILCGADGSALVPLTGALPQHWLKLQSLHAPDQGVATALTARFAPGFLSDELAEEHGHSPCAFSITLSIETSLLHNFFDDENNRPQTPATIEKRQYALSLVAQRDRSRRDELVKRGVLGPDEAVDPSDQLFYLNLDPAPAMASSRVLKPPGLKSALFPFQSRSVLWMLQREGVTVDLDNIDEEGCHFCREMTAQEAEPFMYDPLCEECHFLDGSEPFWANLCSGQAFIERPLARTGNGLLADEIGLGKTVDILALAALHKDKDRCKEPKYHDEETGATVRPSHLTLIICPSAILGQWQEEISKHAPSQRTLVYEGLKDLDESMTPEKVISKYDVLVCSFDTMSREIVYARKPSDRATRSGKKLDYRRSLLVELDFLRVVTDEVQMLTNSSQASEVADFVRRKYSFAVSSTPVRNTLPDLRGPLQFLGLGRLVTYKGAWANFLKAEHLDAFLRLFKTIAIRTTKKAVAHEMALPGQQRYLVPLELGDIERAAYRGRYLEAISDLGLDQDAEAVNADLDVSNLMAWLTRLRQVCFHSQIGAGFALTNRNKENVQTLDEVLVDLQHNATTECQSAYRSHYNAMIRRAHLTSRDRESCEGLEQAIVLFKRAIKGLEQLENEVAQQLGVYQPDRDSDTASISADTDDFIDDDEQDSARPEARGGRRSKAGELKSRLRDCLTLQHTAHFFLGNVFFTVGNRAKEEMDAYSTAATIRKKILSPQQQGIQRATKKLLRYFEEDETDLTDMEVPFATERPGIKTRTIFEDVSATSDRLNAMAELIWEWREQLVQMLAAPISNLMDGEDDEANGDTYDADAQAQEALEVLLDQYKQALADWKEDVTGDRSALSDDLGSATALMRIKDDATSKDLDKSQQAGAVLFARMKRKREKLRKNKTQHLKRCLKDLVDITQSLNRDEEIAIATAEAARLRKLIRSREAVYDGFDKEINRVLLPCFNARTAYFAQLQVFSDSVADVAIKKAIMVEIEICDADEKKFLKEATLKQRKRTYLEFLSAEQKNADADEDICIICADSFDQGLLTACCHVFCADCLTKWLLRAPTCPFCKQPCEKGSYTRVNVAKAYKSNLDDGGVVASTSRGSGHPDQIEEEIRLSLVPPSFDEVLARGSASNNLGIKLDTIIQHIRALREEDPLAKIVLFSAWTEALRLCCSVFEHSGIRYVTLDKAKKNQISAAQQFQSNPEVAVFVLHSQSQAAGLNLTAAKTIVMIEPLLNPALELQAVGRVHRIGQASETQVYQYIIKDTVDERIATRSARNGHPLFLADATLEEQAHQDDEEEHENASMTDISLPAPAPTRQNAEETFTSNDLQGDLSHLLLDREEFHKLQDAILQQVNRQQARAARGASPGVVAPQATNVDLT